MATVSALLYFILWCINLHTWMLLFILIWKMLPLCLLFSTAMMDSIYYLNMLDFWMCALMSHNAMPKWIRKIWDFEKSKGLIFGTIICDWMFCSISLLKGVLKYGVNVQFPTAIQHAFHCSVYICDFITIKKKAVTFLIWDTKTYLCSN